jgi:hypothetical protein
VAGSCDYWLKVEHSLRRRANLSSYLAVNALHRKRTRYSNADAIADNEAGRDHSEAPP